MEQLKNMKQTLVSCIQGQMTHLDSVDAKELGEVVDMVKDLSEAIYYCTITEAMEEKEKNGEHHHYYTEYRYPETQNYRDMDRSNGRMYYNEMPMDYNMNGKAYYNQMPTTYASNGGNGNSSSNGSSSSSGGSSRSFTEMEYPIMRDKREGRSPMSRKSYMEAKEMHQPKTTQMKELEKYLQELSSDITEMIQDASPEEKSFLEKKISTLATKIN